MNITIRKAEEKEYALLNVFLRDAIETSEDDEIPSIKTMKYPHYYAYLENFGKRKGDFALLAQIEESIIGMVWSRIIVGMGSINEQTPTIIACVHKNYRGIGIGKKLITEMYKLLQNEGYTHVSLLVDKKLEAVVRFSKKGYIIEQENEYEYIMVKQIGH